MPVIIQPAPGGGNVVITDSAGVPAGGTAGQYLRKETNADYDTEWADSTTSWGGIDGTLSDQTDLQSALDAKAATSHAHAISDVTGLQTALDSKQASGSYAAATHSHVISDVTNLQASLDNKLDDSQLDTDTTLAANSDTKIATQKAVKAYVDANAGGSDNAGTGWKPGIGMVRQWFGDPTGIQVVGWPTATTIGTDSAPATASTNRLTRMTKRARSTSSANTCMGWIFNGGVPTFLAAPGYVYEAMFGFTTAATIAQKRLFVGMRGSVSFPSGSTDPSAYTDIVGFGADTGDANWQILYNDSSGTATKVDTGWAKALDTVYYVRITGEAGQVKVYAERYDAANLSMTPSAIFAEATYNSNIPADSTAVTPNMFAATGATAENTVFCGIYQSLVSSF